MNQAHSKRNNQSYVGKKRSLRFALMLFGFSFALSTIIIFAYAPSSGLVGTHTFLALSVWGGCSGLLMAARQISVRDEDVKKGHLLKSTLLSVVAAFPVPAILLLLPYGGGVDPGDVLVVVLFSSLAYLYIARSIENR